MRNIINKYKGPLILLLCSFLWGTTFVAQSIGSNTVGPYTFTGIRFIISGVILLITYLLLNIKNLKFKIDKKIFLLAILTGVALSGGSLFQQIGIDATKSAGKSAFITSLYIVFVPIISLLIGKKINFISLVAVFIALTGSYLIASKGKLVFEIGDIYIFICAIFFAVQILLVDYVSKHMNPILLCSIQFLVTGIIGLIFMFIFEQPNIVNIKESIFPILYAAIISGCFGYLLQIIGQKTTNPTLASLIMGLEAVFALISGIIILKETLILKEAIGCILLFVSVILPQINLNKNSNNKDIS